MFKRVHLVSLLSALISFVYEAVFEEWIGGKSFVGVVEDDKIYKV